jgi:stage V sporulation protein AD
MFTIDINNVYINDYYSIGGMDELNSNISHFNLIIKDLYYGESSFEEAEVKMQKTVISNLLINNKIDLLIGGDLSNQLGIMNTSLKNYSIPYLGTYNACATFIESLIIGSLLLSSSIKSIMVLTSSHINTSERQFRFPIEYGVLKKKCQTITMTSSIGTIISKRKSNIRILRATIGKVIDYDIKDASNMGAIMAPAVANTIYNHLTNTHTTIDDYDAIITGDLGSIGLNILINLLKIEHGIITDKIIDAGASTYKCNQNKYAGASGPTVLPIYFFNKVIYDKNIKKVLLVSSGSLHNPTMVNLKLSIPSISHAIEIEVNHDN